jgi:hypothetical protein
MVYSKKNLQFSFVIQRYASVDYNHAFEYGSTTMGYTEWFRNSFLAPCMSLPLYETKGRTTCLNPTDILKKLDKNVILMIDVPSTGRRSN